MYTVYEKKLGRYVCDLVTCCDRTTATTRYVDLTILRGPTRAREMAIVGRAERCGFFHVPDGCTVYSYGQFGSRYANFSPELLSKGHGKMTPVGTATSIAEDFTLRKDTTFDGEFAARVAQLEDIRERLVRNKPILSSRSFQSKFGDWDIMGGGGQPREPSRPDLSTMCAVAAHLGYKGFHVLLDVVW